MPESRGRSSYRRSRSRSRSRSPSRHESVKRLHLADLNESVKRRDVEDVFSKYGRLADVWVASYPPYYGFVVFERSEDAQDALREMKRGYIGKCPIRTTVALPRGSRKPRSPPPRYRDRYESSRNDRDDRDYRRDRDYERPSSRRKDRSPSPAPRRRRSPSNSPKRRRTPSPSRSPIHRNRSPEPDNVSE
uniref:RRM domain-containing protein n=1 Tax=Panagrolaimus sp. JU765 TaxID=591449 RepID=A0AC34R546_9BILA